LDFLGSGVLAGIVLWFVAQGVLAPLMGRSFMMGFGSYTQSSFVGHVGMTIRDRTGMEKLLNQTAVPRPEDDGGKPT